MANEMKRRFMKMCIRDRSKTNKIEEIAAFYNQVVEQQKEGK